MDSLSDSIFQTNLGSESRKKEMSRHLAQICEKKNWQWEIDPEQVQLMSVRLFSKVTVFTQRETLFLLWNLIIVKTYVYFAVIDSQ